MFPGLKGSCSRQLYHQVIYFKLCLPLLFAEADVHCCSLLARFLDHTMEVQQLSLLNWTTLTAPLGR